VMQAAEVRIFTILPDSSAAVRLLEGTTPEAFRV